MRKKTVIPNSDDTLFPEIQANPAPVSEEGVIHDDTFSYDGYEVVRQEFFAHTHEPSITFNNRKVYMNTTCLKRLPNVSHVQFLIHRGERKLLVHPSGEDETDTLSWCTQSAKRNPKQISGPIFVPMIMDLMDWNPNYRYKLLGKFICSNGRYLFVFDLTMPNIYRRVSRGEENPKLARLPLFPEEWRSKFGLPVEEHRKRLQVKIFKDHVFFGIKDDRQTESPNGESTP